MILEKEEIRLKESLSKGIHPDRTDLWPAIAPKVMNAGKRKVPARILVPVFVLAAALCLMGAGYLKHWYVFDSSGNKTELTENEGYSMGDTTIEMLEERASANEVFYDYDWVDYEIPTVDIFETDYQAFKEALKGNVLGLTVPDAAVIPKEYDQHQRFMADRYLLEEDLPEDRSSEKALRQIGWIEMQWFRADKKPLTLSACLVESDDLLITAPEEDHMDVHTVEVKGYEKAVVSTYDNLYYKDQGINLYLWKEVEPMEVLVPIQENGNIQKQSVHYLFYAVSSIGLTEEELIAIAQAWQ